MKRFWIPTYLFEAGKKVEKGIILSLIVYIALTVGKLYIYSVTRIIVLLAEGLHSLSDVMLVSFLLLTATVSFKPPDSTHMYGHERAQNIGALVAATLFITFVSFEGFIEAFTAILEGTYGNVTHIEVATSVIVTSMLAESFPLFVLYRKRKNHAPASRAQFYNVIQDECALFASLVGIFAITRGYPIGDPIAAIFVSATIFVSGLALFYDNAVFLLGKSPDTQTIKKLRKVVEETPGVIKVTEFRAMYVGPDILNIGIKIEVARDISIEEADAIAENVSKRLMKIVKCRSCLVHADPYPSKRNA